MNSEWNSLQEKFHYNLFSVDNEDIKNSRLMIYNAEFLYLSRATEIYGAYIRIFSHSPV